MSKDRTKLVGWVCLDGYTLRWRRGDPAAYVFRGHQVFTADSNTGAIDIIGVPTSGWMDLAQVRQIAEAWLDGAKPRLTSSPAFRRRRIPVG